MKNLKTKNISRKIEYNNRYYTFVYVYSRAFWKFGAWIFYRNVLEYESGSKCVRMTFESKFSTKFLAKANVNNFANSSLLV